VQRLLTSGDVDDGQTPVAEAEAGFNVQAALVGPAVVLAVVHALQHGSHDLARRTQVKDAGDAAHGLSWPLH